MRRLRRSSPLDDFAGYWRDAAVRAPALCARLRAFLRPCWGHELGHPVFTHGDLNLANVLVEGGRVTGVVDWDDFALNSRAADLGTVLFEWYRLALGGQRGLADRGAERVTARIAEIAGQAGLRCIVAYAAVARLAVSARRRQWAALERWMQVTESALGDLGG